MEEKKLTVRIDSELKAEFDKVCKELGFTTSSAVRMFAKQVIKTKSLPFTISIDTVDKK